MEIIRSLGAVVSLAESRPRALDLNCFIPPCHFVNVKGVGIALFDFEIGGSRGLEGSVG